MRWFPSIFGSSWGSLKRYLIIILQMDKDNTVFECNLAYNVFIILVFNDNWKVAELIRIPEIHGQYLILNVPEHIKAFPRILLQSIYD